MGLDLVEKAGACLAVSLGAQKVDFELYLFGNLDHQNREFEGKSKQVLLIFTNKQFSHFDFKLTSQDVSQFD